LRHHHKSVGCAGRHVGSICAKAREPAEVVSPGHTHVSDYNFVMRCWERDEINTLLARHHLTLVEPVGMLETAEPDVSPYPADVAFSVRRL
jgi:hypothetical protein